MKITTTYLIILIAFFSSCDKIERTDFLQGDNNGGGGVDTTTIVQKVLIEDFTGYKCTNCPLASSELYTIENLFEGKIVGIGVHSGFFAAPSGVFTTDFRTTAGDELATFFGPESFPIGMVNRKGYPENVLVDYTEWASMVTEILNQTPSVGILLSESNNKITVRAKSLSDISGNLKLVVCITEDKIIDYQIDGVDLVEDYEHNHVLRTNVNGTWGTDITLTSEYSSFEFDYSLDNNWVRSNCNVVAYVYNDSNKEVLQAEKIHLTD